MDLVRNFLERTIVAVGGIVEESVGTLEVLLPREAAQRLGVPEEACIRVSGERDEQELDGRFGSPLVERLVRTRLAAPPLAAAAVPAELSRAFPEKLPVLLNAVCTGDPQEAHEAARYLVCHLRLALHGEDVRSTLESVTIRLADGARVNSLRLSDAYPIEASRLSEEEHRGAADAIRMWARDQGPRLLAGALETLRRRAVRDLERMAEYFASLDREMAAAVGRARSEEERARRRLKRRGLSTALAERRAQVRERMRPRLTASLVAGLLVETEVVRFDLPVRRRSRDCWVPLRARAADGILEGPRCAACGAETLRLYVCDERSHVLCEECGQPGRLDTTRCRACSGTRRPTFSMAIEDPTATLRLGVDRPHGE
jgi:hypothetical protein